MILEKEGWGCREWVGRTQSTSYGTGLYQNEVLAPNQKGGKNMNRKGWWGAWGKGVHHLMIAVPSVKYKARSPITRRRYKRSEKASEIWRVAEQL